MLKLKIEEAHEMIDLKYHTPYKEFLSYFYIDVENSIPIFIKDFYNDAKKAIHISNFGFGNVIANSYNDITLFLGRKGYNIEVTEPYLDIVLDTIKENINKDKKET